ncbi:hypothetical protein [Rhodococcus koreensis]|uniref:hypothetical protein n=1 Tax=Rhodococcus koreensis TaxID=99653 RepID=UPI0036D96BD7
MPGRPRPTPGNPEAFGHIAFGPALPPTITTLAPADTHTTTAAIDTARAAVRNTA